MLAAAIGFAGCGVGHAQSAAPAKPQLRQGAASDVSAQQRATVRRAPARITVTPLRRARLSPNAVRDCVGWYQTEYRPSGTVITPQLRCRWIDG